MKQRSDTLDLSRLFKSQVITIQGQSLRLYHFEDRLIGGRTLAQRFIGNANWKEYRFGCDGNSVSILVHFTDIGKANPVAYYHQELLKNHCAGPIDLHLLKTDLALSGVTEAILFEKIEPENQAQDLSSESTTPGTVLSPPPEPSQPVTIINQS